MRVAQILYSGLGGHGSVAFSLLNADKEAQWQPVMGFLGIEPLSPAYVESCREKGIAYAYFPAVSGKPWRAWPGILNWLNRSCPDAVILHSVTALLPCWWHARSRKVPLLMVEHQPNALKKHSEWAISRLAMWLADFVVLLTPVYRQELQEKLGWGYRDSKVRLIPNGIDTNRFSPVSRKSDLLNSVVQLGMAARFTSTKRQDALVRMMLHLRRLAPTVDWRLSLAGSGETWESLRKMVQQEGLGECINLPGHLNEVKLIEWFQSLDIYLHASAGETLSTSLLQAMATGLPIVASDVPGINNLLSGEPGCGLLIEDSSPEGFANAVVNLVDNPSQASQFSLAARKLAVTAYSQDAMFSGYASLICEMNMESTG